MKLKSFTIKTLTLGTAMTAAIMLSGCSHTHASGSGTQQLLAQRATTMAKAAISAAHQVVNTLPSAKPYSTAFITNCAQNPTHYATEPQVGSGRKNCHAMYQALAKVMSQQNQYSAVTGKDFKNKQVQQRLQSVCPGSTPPYLNC